jgi:hypothetical protein
VSFLHFTLAVLVLLVVLVTAAAVTAVRKRIRKHSLIILLWRWHTGMPHHGREVTDAGWFRPASSRAPLTRTGHTSRFQHRRRWERTALRTGPELAALFALYGLLTATLITVLCLGAAALAALGYAAWRIVRRIRGREHRRHWLEPAHAALAARFGHAVANPPDSWLQLARDRSHARLALPPGRVFDAAEQAQLSAAAITKLGITGADPRQDVQWKQAGPQPHVSITRPVPCPPLVTLADIQSAIDSARWDELVLGIGRRGVITKPSIAINSPHVLASMLSGVGKSTLAKVILAPQLYRGAIVLMLDIKQWSHPWFYGLPNVAYCHDEESCFGGLLWLGREIEARNALCARNVDIEGVVHADVGPRIFVCVEEINELVTRLRRWWAAKVMDDRRLPARCPALDVTDRVHFVGRQVRVHSVDIGQMVTARAAGSSEARENTAGIRIMGQPTPPHWKMLVAQHPFPSSVTPHPGRVFVVKADAVMETQIAMLTGAEARGLGLGGTVTPCPEGMPFRAWHPRLSAVPVTAEISDSTTPDLRDYQPGPVPVTGPDGGVTLAEAVEAGLLRTSIHNARQLRYRRRLGLNDMPLPTGKRGVADTWDPIALADWWGMREARQMTGETAA